MNQHGISLVKILFFVAALFLCMSGFVLYVSLNPQVAASVNSLFKNEGVTAKITLSEQEIHHVVTPAVLKITHEIEGNVRVIQDFKINLDRYEIEESISKKTHIVPVDKQNISGIGLIVSPDGYILTHPDVALGKKITDESIRTLSKELLDKSIALIPKSSRNRFTAYSKTEEGARVLDNLFQDINTRLRNNADIQVKSSLLATNSSTENNFPAEVVFEKEDVSVLKINQDNLPTVPVVNNNYELKKANKIFVIGYPNAEEGVLPTVYSGTIINLNSSSSDARSIELDIDVSDGFRGGVAVDEHGTFLSLVPASQTFKENITVPIPEPPSEFTATQGLLFNHFIKGLHLMNNRYCAEAIKEFEHSLNINSKFVGDRTLPYTYIDSCKDIQLKGHSIDSEWDKLIYNIWSIKNQILHIVILCIALLAFIIVTYTISNRIKRNKIEFNKVVHPVRLMQTPVHADTKDVLLHQAGSVEDAPAENISIDNLGDTETIVSIIKEQQQAGTNGGPLVLLLRKKGYTDAQIQDAFSIVNKVDY